MDRSTEHLADLTSRSDGIPFNSIQLSKYGLATGRAGAISWMHGSLAWKGEAISRVTPITYFKHVMSGWTKPIPGHLTNEGTTTARSPGRQCTGDVGFECAYVPDLPVAVKLHPQRH